MDTETTRAPDATEVVRSICESYANAVNTADAGVYSSLFTTAAIRMPPGTPPERGQAEIRAAEQATYDAVSLEIRSTPIDALPLADDWI